MINLIFSSNLILIQQNFLMFLISLDPCEPNPCGAGAKCVSDKGNALCSCPVGKTGNPLVRCGKYLKKNQYY